MRRTPAFPKDFLLLLSPTFPDGRPNVGGKSRGKPMKKRPRPPLPPLPLLLAGVYSPAGKTIERRPPHGQTTHRRLPPLARPALPGPARRRRPVRPVLPDRPHPAGRDHLVEPGPVPEGERLLQGRGGGATPGPRFRLAGVL